VSLSCTLNYSYSGSNPTVAVMVATGTTIGATAYSTSWNTSGTGAPFTVAEELTLNANGWGRTTTIADFQGWNQLYGTSRVHMRLLNDGMFLHLQYSANGFDWSDWNAQLSPENFSWYGFWIGSETNIGSNAWVEVVVSTQTLAIPQQYAVTASTGAGVPVVVTIGPHTILPGDMVSVYGMTGNTAANSSVPPGSYTGCTLVTAVTATTITLGQQANGGGTITGNGTWTGGGTITLLTR
jgi:hypothetical protein